MDLSSSNQPDLDAIARNLIALDIAHINPEEATAYEHELSVIAALNDALETTALALRLDEPPLLWQRLQPMLSDAAALLSSQIAPLLDLNAERHFEMSEHPTRPILALTSSSSREIEPYRAS
ncbi:MAG: hypothetical protein AAF050_01890 [Cyanobacteria bacterium J06649_5]